MRDFRRRSGRGRVSWRAGGRAVCRAAAPRRAHLTVARGVWPASPGRRAVVAARCSARAGPPRGNARVGRSACPVCRPCFGARPSGGIRFRPPRRTAARALGGTGSPSGAADRLAGCRGTRTSGGARSSGGPGGARPAGGAAARLGCWHIQRPRTRRRFAGPPGWPASHVRARYAR
jgi:hypothetical protein